MKILLDENLPRKLVAVLRAEGHEVESVHTLRLDGLASGKLYEFACDNFDLCSPIFWWQINWKTTRLAPITPSINEFNSCLMYVKPGQGQSTC